MSAISFILSCFFIQPLWAATFDVPVAEGDRLLLKGLEAQVQLIGQPGAALRVSGVENSGSAEGQYVITKSKGVIEIKMNEYSGKRAWLQVLTRSATPARIEITGPAVPTEVHLRGGSVGAQRWNKDIKVAMTQGRAQVVGGSGAVQVYLQKGDVTVQDRVGRVQADSYQGAMTLRNIQGDVESHLFAGSLQIEKVQGFTSVSTQTAQGRVNQGVGTLQFENGKGTLTVQGFQGRLEGQNQEGVINVTMALDSEVDVKSKAGRVQIQAPPAAGVTLNLLTTEGDILVPGDLKVTKLSTEKSLRAKWRGDAPRGSIFVRTQEGLISVK
ncbi:MAG: DUF4097 family beta strand repeat-containing protein [Bdellovibrio sp.]